MKNTKIDCWTIAGYKRVSKYRSFHEGYIITLECGHEISWESEPNKGNNFDTFDCLECRISNNRENSN